jgi:methyl-accepting chemotaxis protein
VFISDIQVANILSMTDVSKMDVADFVASVNEKRINDFIRNVNDGLQDSVNRGMAGSEALLVVLVSDQGFLPKNMVMAASRDDLTFVQVPDYLVDAFDEGKRYLYLDEGVPELGFQGEYLVSLIPLKNPYTADNLLLAIRPFHNEVARIDDFQSGEKNRLTLILVLVIAGGTILIFLVTFFILRRMIYKQITKPVYELASAAGEVMEGNLDVEIEVHKGEEFESLKNAFREMLKTIRDIVNRSLEGEK